MVEFIVSRKRRVRVASCRRLAGRVFVPMEYTSPVDHLSTPTHIIGKCKDRRKVGKGQNTVEEFKYLP